jgi:actin beta/gamma 1
MGDELQTLVIENSSDMCKVGFAGEKAPRSVFPSILRRTKHVKAVAGRQNKDTSVRDEASAKTAILSLKYSIEHRFVTNCDEIENISQNTFYNELRVHSDQHSGLLTEDPFNLKANREKMILILFETFNVTSFDVRIQVVLSLYSSHNTTGFVFDARDGVSHILPIYQRYSLTHPILDFNLTECHFTASILKIFDQRRDTFTNSAEIEIIRDINEKFADVSFDFQAELQKAEKTTDCNVSHTFTDRNKTVIANQRFRCPELLFKLSLNAFQFHAIEKTLFHSIINSEMDVGIDSSANIVLSDGIKMFLRLPQPSQN